MSPDFSKLNGLVPVVIQDNRTLEVLMLGFMNEQAYLESVASGYVHFFSRSRNRLWKKGEQSGNVLQIKSMSLDCDSDSLLVLATPTGPVCHTGARSCFQDARADGAVINRLETIIAQRSTSPQPGSYVSSIFQAGIARIAQKVGEEATEVVIAALLEAESSDALTQEAADLVFHLLVLLAARRVSFADVLTCLARRER